MDLVLTKEVVKNLLVREDFYHKVPEFYYLKEAGAKIVSALDDEGRSREWSERSKERKKKRGKNFVSE